MLGHLGGQEVKNGRAKEIAARRVRDNDREVEQRNIHSAKQEEKRVGRERTAVGGRGPLPGGIAGRSGRAKSGTENRSAKRDSSEGGRGP